MKESVECKITTGTTIAQAKIFLHTEPHHDDIMLGYLPHIVRHIREHSNQHHFVTLTSGFTAVTNQYMLDLLTKLRRHIAEGTFERLLEACYFESTNTIGRTAMSGATWTAWQPIQNRCKTMVNSAACVEI